MKSKTKKVIYPFFVVRFLQQIFLENQLKAATLHFLKTKKQLHLIFLWLFGISLFHKHPVSTCHIHTSVFHAEKSYKRAQRSQRSVRRGFCLQKAQGTMVQADTQTNNTASLIHWPDVCQICGYTKNRYLQSYIWLMYWRMSRIFFSSKEESEGKFWQRVP